MTSIVFSQKQVEVNQKLISAEITFGRLGHDCKGRGICSFNTTSNTTKHNTQIKYHEDNRITLVIDRTRITKEEELKIVGQDLEVNTKIKEGLFVLEDDFILEALIKSELKTPHQITKVAKGNYSLLISKDTFTITLKIE